MATTAVVEAIDVLEDSCLRLSACWPALPPDELRLHPISWRKEYGGLKTDQVRRMKELEKENQRLRRAISDLTLDKLILQEAAKGNF